MINYLYTLDYSDQDLIDTVNNKLQYNTNSAVTAQIAKADSTEGEDSQAENGQAGEDSKAKVMMVADETTLLLRLTINALVYALGEKYNIPDLKVLAESKFMEVVYECPTADLSSIVETVYTTTPSSDIGLRCQIVDVCTHRLPELMESRDFVEIMTEHGSLGSKLLGLEVRRRLTHEDTNQKLAETEKSLRETKKKLIGIEARLADTQRNWDTTSKALERTNRSLANLQ